MMNERQQHDVFLSHNSLDKEEVQIVANYLKKQGLKAWLDRSEIYVGSSLPSEIKEAIYYSKSAAFFIGKHGLGRWQKEELEILETQRADKQLEIFPILLPSVLELPNRSEFLSLRRLLWVSLATSDDVKALNNLTSSIRNYTQQWAAKELERLHTEKEKAEEERQRINEEIDKVKTQLEPQTMERKEALDWLDSARNSVEVYGRKALKRFPALEIEVQRRNEGRNEFYAELEVCVEFVYYTFRSKECSYLDEMSIELSLADSSIYRETANPHVYEVVVDLIIEEVPDGQRLSEATRNELENYLNRLKKRIRLLT